MTCMPAVEPFFRELIENRIKMAPLHDTVQYIYATEQYI